MLRGNRGRKKIALVSFFLLDLLVLRVLESSAELVNPGEARSVVEVEGGMVVVMELGASIAGKIVEEVEGQFVAAVSDDSVELAQLDPDVEGEEMGTDDDGRGEGGGTEDNDLGPVSVRSAETEGRLELVVNLVDPLVEPLDVQPTVAPVLEPVLSDEEEAHLPGEGPKRRPLGVMTHSQKVEDGPARDDHGDDDDHVVEENVLDASPVVHHGVQLAGLDLVLLQPSHLFDDDEDGSRPDVGEGHEGVEDHEDVEGLVLGVQSSPNSFHAAPVQGDFMSIFLAKFNTREVRLPNL